MKYQITCDNCGTQFIIDAEPGMNADALEITTQDTAITVKNISGKDMGQVYVYYKVAYGELYLGGIT